MIEKVQLFFTFIIILMILLTTVHIDSQNRQILNEIKNVKNVVISSNEINTTNNTPPAVDLESSIDNIRTIMNSFNSINEEDEVQDGDDEPLE